MGVWISENWLALYGSVVGTIALFVNLSRHFHQTNKDKVKLSVSFKSHPEKEQNINKLHDTEGASSWARQDIVEVIVVEIRNNGNVKAYVNSVVAVNSKGERKSALTNKSTLLEPVSDSNNISVEPKSKEIVYIYHSRGEELFEARYIEVTDSLGVCWREYA